MKIRTLLLTGLLGVSLSTSAALYNSGFENGGLIPDGNLSGWSDTRTVSGLLPVIDSVSVTLNLSGGYNGDLYAYLSYGGSQLVLLNRVGVGTGTEPTYSFGYSGAGFTGLVLQDGASDIHTYGGGVGSGTYSADGRDVSPLAAPATLYGTSQDTFAGTFGGANPNGDWTLFFADVSVGGGQSQLLDWSLDITAVPEPTTWALGIFGGLAGLIGICRTSRCRSLLASLRQP